jgi:serine/threonine-protein kinase
MTTLINNRFTIAETIGEGGMGFVYRGVDTLTNEPVAIKKLKQEAVIKNPEQLERFRREALVLFQLNHPNMVRVYDAVTQNGDYYIVMQYVDGGSLRELLKREKKLPIYDVVNMSLDIADALARAHRLKIVHRDVKPDNVLLSSTGTPYLTDFGQAHIADAPGLTRPGQILGTINYMAPEIFAGQSADRRSDIWAFGIMLYEMLTGFRPFMGQNSAQLMTAIIKQPAPDIRKLRQDCPERVAEIIHRMLAKERDDRLFTIREASLQLEYALYELEQY